ncbi:MAG: hypothetical protein LJE74_11960, partial [Proteobacteria bacterium]|nr:hypothetical protein [Pseudomonadota bacterium]
TSGRLKSGAGVPKSQTGVSRLTIYISPLIFLGIHARCPESRTTTDRYLTMDPADGNHYTGRTGKRLMIPVRGPAVTDHPRSDTPRTPR